MTVSYKRLWKLLIDKDMKKADLRRATGISSFTLARMTHGEDVSLDVLKRCCEVLHCGVGDVVEFIPEKTNEYALADGRHVEAVK